MTCGHQRPDTTIPTSADVIRALGAWLAPDGGPDDQDRLVELILRAHAHPDYHPEAPGDLADICRLVAVAGDDETALWRVVNGATGRPCANRLAAHGPLADTPPALPGDVDGLCRSCRDAVTIRVFGQAAGDADDDPTRPDRFRTAALDVIRRLPTPELEALHTAAGGGGGFG